MMSNKMKQPVQMEIDMSRLKKTEILFQSRRDCGIQTVDEKVNTALDKYKYVCQFCLHGKWPNSHLINIEILEGVRQGCLLRIIHLKSELSCHGKI